jgi:hypothetical protein
VRQGTEVLYERPCPDYASDVLEGVQTVSVMTQYMWGGIDSTAEAECYGLQNIRWFVYQLASDDGFAKEALQRERDPGPRLRLARVPSRRFARSHAERRVAVERLNELQLARRAIETPADSRDGPAASAAELHVRGRLEASLAVHGWRGEMYLAPTPQQSSGGCS